jgi:plasma kallikrein
VKKLRKKRDLFCRKEIQGLKIRAGEWDTQTKNELLPHQDRTVVQTVIHPEYYAGALYNDVALLRLDAPVDAADNVDVVCLPEQNQQFDRSRCFASGWGKNVFGKEGQYQVILKKVEMPTVPRQQCLQALRKTRLGQHFRLHNSFMCAGGEPGKDTCKVYAQHSRQHHFNLHVSILNFT